MDILTLRDALKAQTIAKRQAYSVSERGGDGYDAYHSQIDYRARFGGIVLSGQDLIDFATDYADMPWAVAGVKADGEYFALWLGHHNAILHSRALRPEDAIKARSMKAQMEEAAAKARAA